MILRCLLALFAVSLTCGASEHWRAEYIYNAPDNSDLDVEALAFPSVQQGMAVGFVELRDKRRPYGIVTADGGRTWKPVRVPDDPVSLFFLNPSAGWLVGADHIWHTTDFGATWKKIEGAQGALRVYFLTEKHGWAIGTKKSVYETTDGGANWTRVPAAAEPKTTAENTVYEAISFVNDKAGMIAGWSEAPRRRTGEELPYWLDPEKARREWPGITIVLETQDGGQHWKPSSTTLFGHVTRISTGPDGNGLGLIEFFDRFEYASEVVRLELRTGKSAVVFRRKDRAITDLALTPDGTSYLAGIEPPGSYARSPIPGKVKILKSIDSTNFTDMDVDYRAVARKVVLATAGGQFWAATDTGIILHLVQD